MFNKNANLKCNKNNRNTGLTVNAELTLNAELKQPYNTKTRTTVNAIKTILVRYSNACEYSSPKQNVPPTGKYRKV